MKHEPMDLYDYIEIESSIQCSNCGKDDLAIGDNREEYFFDKGWRATKNGNVYCPKCALKKLKHIH